MVIGRRATPLEKGLNYYGNDGYTEAWRADYYYEDYANTGWGHDNQENGFMGNLIMLLERRSESKDKQKMQETDKKTEKTRDNGKRDALLGTRMRRPMKVQKSFAEFSNVGDDDDGNDNNNDTTKTDQIVETTKETNHNKKQRAKRRINATIGRKEQCPIGGARIISTITSNGDSKWYVWSGRGRTLARFEATKQWNGRSNEGNATRLIGVNGSVCTYSDSGSNSEACGNEFCNNN